MTGVLVKSCHVVMAWVVTLYSNVRQKTTIRTVGVGRSFAKFVSKFAMLCIFPLREISCEICYAVHFPPAEIRSVGREGHRTGPYRTEDGEKNEIQTPEIAIFLRKLSISTKAVTSMIESISRISKLGSILRFF